MKTSKTVILDVWKHIKQKSKMHPIFSAAIYHTRLSDFLPKMDSFQAYMADQIPYKNIQYRVYSYSKRYKAQHYLTFFKEIIVSIKRLLRPIARKHLLRHLSALLIRGSYCSSARRYKRYSFIYCFGFKYKVRNPKRKNRGYLRRVKKFIISHSNCFPKLLRKRTRRLTYPNNIPYFRKRTHYLTHV